MLTLAKHRTSNKPQSSAPCYGPSANGLQMTPHEFDRGEFERGWRYELVNGVLIVSPSPVLNERETKRDEHLIAGVQEYWIFDRFAQTLTVWTKNGRRAKRVLTAEQTFSPARLPGLVLGLRKLFDLANRWDDESSHARPTP